MPFRTREHIPRAVLSKGIKETYAACRFTSNSPDWIRKGLKLRSLLAKGRVFINWLAPCIKTGCFGCGMIVAIYTGRGRNIQWCEWFTIEKELAFRRKACLSGKQKTGASTLGKVLDWVSGMGVTCSVCSSRMNNCKGGAGETKVKLLEAVGCIGAHAFYRGSAPSLGAMPLASTKQNFIQIHQGGSDGIG